MKNVSQKVVGNAQEGRKKVFEAIATGVICLALAGLAAWQLVPLVDENYFLSVDSAYYLTLGRSLLRGEGYVFSGLPHTQYPPLYPLLTAAIQYYRGMDFEALRLAQVVLGIGVAVFSFLFAKKSLGLIGGAAAAILVVANRDFVLQSAVMLLSEPLFMLLSLLAIFLAREAWKAGSSFWWIAAAALVAGEAALTRSVGVYAFPFLAIGFLSRSKMLPGFRRMMLYLLIFGAIAGGWGLRNKLVAPHDNGLYLRSLQSKYGMRHSVKPEKFSESVEKVKEKAAYEQVSAAALMLNRLHEVKSKPLLMGITALLLVGWVIRVWRDKDPTHYYAAVYFAIYCAWPFEEQNRFLLPILPMLLVYALSVPRALVRIACWKAPKWAAPTAFLGILLIFGGYYWKAGQPYVRAFPKDVARSNGYFEDAKKALDNLSEKDRSDAVFYSMRPSVVALAGDVRVLGGYRLDSPADFPDYLRDHKCNHIEALESNALMQEYLGFLKEKHPQRVSLICQKGSVQIYRYSAKTLEKQTAKKLRGSRQSRTERTKQPE